MATLANGKSWASRGKKLSSLPSLVRWLLWSPNVVSKLQIRERRAASFHFWCSLSAGVLVLISCCSCVNTKATSCLTLVVQKNQINPECLLQRLCFTFKGKKTNKNPTVKTFPQCFLWNWLQPFSCKSATEITYFYELDLYPIPLLMSSTSTCKEELGQY